MSEAPERVSSIGVAVRSRIPVDAQGNFPINRTLIAVLGFALAFFNQALFWLLAVLLAGQGRDIVAGRFLVASLVLGAALWFVLTVVQWRATGGGRATDWMVVALTGLLGAAGVASESPGCLIASVLLLTAWGSRGLIRK